MIAYTGGATWTTGTKTINPSVGYGYDITEITNILTDINSSAVSSCTIELKGSNASMADTAQGGIWGDFDGETTPSALAIVYKNLIRIKTNTLNLNGIIKPAATGDGTGFPSGFGNWYRS